MPIKFRCQHCRQFLGISRAQAGAVVDCPTCGRTLRVPKLDGTVEPISDPKMNLHDDELVRALDELASLGDGESAVSSGHDPESALDSDSENPVQFAGVGQKADDQVVMLAPVPAPEPVALEPPLPAEPVAEPPEPDSSQPLETVVAPAQKPAHSPLSELVKLGVTAPATSHADADEPAEFNWRTLLTPMALMTISICCAVAFTAGVFVGRTQRTEAPVASNETDKNPTDDAKKVEQVEADANDEVQKPALKGRITFKTESGEIRPDRGARVLVLPVQRVGTAKMSIVGFRAADSAEDFAVSSAAITALGGGVATTDDEGNFEVFLKEAGNFRIVVLSHFHSQDAGGQPDENLQAVLASYFDSPTQLLGRLSYYSSEVRYSGVDTLPLDYSFGG